MLDYLICVATINGPKRLEEFISSVYKHTDPSLNFKVSIVDDNSIPELRDANYQVAVKYNCYYRWNDTRLGVAASWNKAASLAESKNLVISNDDILLVPGWLNAYDEFTKANSEKRLGSIAWRVTNTLGEQSKDTKFTVGPFLKHIKEPVVAPAGCLFAVNKELYYTVEGFDERYFASWEEIDFGAKLCLLGYKNMEIDNPIVYHQNSASFSDPINQQDPAFERAKDCQRLWIEKWSQILGIKKGKKSDQKLIKDISDTLTDKQPVYKDFATVEINNGR